MFGMNGYKILKCFRKEKRVSGELPRLVTGLIYVPVSMGVMCTEKVKDFVTLVQETFYSFIRRIPS